MTTVIIIHNAEILDSLSSFPTYQCLASQQLNNLLPTILISLTNFTSASHAVKSHLKPTKYSDCCQRSKQNIALDGDQFDKSHDIESNIADPSQQVDECLGNPNFFATSSE